jgi:hypothetical protein
MDLNCVRSKGLRLKTLDIEGLSVGELKKKAGELWEQIVVLESDIYDLEDRQKRQSYDVSCEYIYFPF